MISSSNVKDGVKGLIGLEVLHRLYQDKDISEILNKLTLEERQKLFDELKENPEYQKELNKIINNL